MRKDKKIEKILLVQPWRDEKSTVFGEMEPYALMVLATALKKCGFDVMILDLRIEPDALSKTIKEFQPDLVGITAITIDYWTAIEAALIVKQGWPNILLAIGGHHATMMPDDFFEPFFNLIFRGPSVEIFPQAIQAINNQEDLGKIKGLIYQTETGNFLGGKDWTDNIREGIMNFLPDRSLLRHSEKYSCFGYNCGVVSTAQGCTNRCNFCACWPAMGGKYITKSAELVVKEILDTPQKYIFLADDNTFGDIKRAWKIAYLLNAELKKTGRKIILDGYCRADTIAENKELFKAWAKIGLKYLTIGMEAISDDKLKDFNKKSSVIINEKANDILLECGIVNLAHILIQPNFDAEDFVGIWDYIEKLGIIHPVFPTFTPFPGTTIWKKEKKIGKEFYPYFDLAHPLLPTKMSKKMYFKWLEWLMQKNYSYKRWGLARTKSLINFVCAKIGFASPFSYRECRAPEIWTIPLYRYWTKKAGSSEHLAPFFEVIQEKA